MSMSTSEGKTTFAKKTEEEGRREEEEEEEKEEGEDAARCGSWALCWSLMQRFFLVSLPRARRHRPHHGCAARRRCRAAASAAPGEAAVPSPRLP